MRCSGRPRRVEAAVWVLVVVARASGSGEVVQEGRCRRGRGRRVGVRRYASAWGSERAAEMPRALRPVLAAARSGAREGSARSGWRGRTRRGARACAAGGSGGGRSARAIVHQPWASRRWWGGGERADARTRPPARCHRSLLARCRLRPWSSPPCSFLRAARSVPVVACSVVRCWLRWAADESGGERQRSLSSTRSCWCGG